MFSTNTYFGVVSYVIESDESNSTSQSPGLDSILLIPSVEGTTKQPRRRPGSPYNVAGEARCSPRAESEKSAGFRADSSENDQARLPAGQRQGFLRSCGEYLCLQSHRSEDVKDCLWIGALSSLECIRIGLSYKFVPRERLSPLVVAFPTQTQQTHLHRFLQNIGMEVQAFVDQDDDGEGGGRGEGADDSQAVSTESCCSTTATATTSQPHLKKRGREAPDSHLEQSDPTVVQTYFQYYGRMVNQMNMLQDAVRTGQYKLAIERNAESDFAWKRVMDVGAGSGILSFFAKNAGAQEVICVEASSMAEVIEVLIHQNATPTSDFRDHEDHDQECSQAPPPSMRVINKTVEMTSLEEDLGGERVDVLVSEPLGIFLFNERMIESYLYARDKFLKPGGKMYPNKCTLCLAPFSDSVMYSDVVSRCTFWTKTDFYGKAHYCLQAPALMHMLGVDLSPAVHRAIEEHLKQPVIDYVDPKCIVSRDWYAQVFDLETIERRALAEMEFFFRFEVVNACVVHGFVGWFDVFFEGSSETVSFSTAPWHPPTHWYQIRFLLKTPIALNPGQALIGSLKMTSNSQQSYSVEISTVLEGTNIVSKSAIIDLRDPDYRYYSNPQYTYVPPSTGGVGPATVDSPASPNQTNLGVRFGTEADGGGVAAS